MFLTFHRRDITPLLYFKERNLANLDAQSLLDLVEDSAVGSGLTILIITDLEPNKSKIKFAEVNGLVLATRRVLYQSM